ncbi:unnamed protein product [Allacma fusca]|uniref:Uncharacterized protein n=1 Tax=Allacma fusca TaxID=39272 RepID=A0A8J2JP84_9HEXA|nr:unnamed protein product [Allacma fusca]
MEIIACRQLSTHHKAWSSLHFSSSGFLSPQHHIKRVNKWSQKVRPQGPLPSTSPAQSKNPTFVTQREYRQWKGIFFHPRTSRVIVNSELSFVCNTPWPWKWQLAVAVSVGNPLCIRKGEHYIDRLSWSPRGKRYLISPQAPYYE